VDLDDAVVAELNALTKPDLDYPWNVLPSALVSSKEAAPSTACRQSRSSDRNDAIFRRQVTSYPPWGRVPVGFVSIVTHVLLTHLGVRLAAARR